MEKMKNEILKYLDEHARSKRTLKDMQEGLHLQEKKDLRKFDDAINELIREYLIFPVKDYYETREQAGVSTGRISINRAGMGFIDREDRESIKIAPEDQNTALNGDTVLVQCKAWQVYGTVLTVLERDREHIVGTYEDNGRKLCFVPDDEKLQNKLMKVYTDTDFTPMNGMKVICHIEDYGTPLKLRVVRQIGFKDDPGVDILSILLDHDIESEFPEDVQEQLKTIPQEVKKEDKKGRVDLTDQMTVTIDGDDSKDFDDAVSVKTSADGWLLKVSIADVSHYVTEDSPLDKEARRRGCSTYVTDRVVGMLPHEMSNGICSLNPHVERLTLTCAMQVNRDGSIKQYEIYPSFIRSDERMTYNHVNMILDGDEKLQEEYVHLGTLLYDLRDCADAIREYRTRKGAIAFETSESEILCDKNGHPYEIHAKLRGHAEEMIEDCMIAANVCVANFLKWQEIPAIYRIHERPQARRIKDFVRVSEQLGHKLNIGQSDIYPNEIQRYLDSVQNTPEYPVLSTLLLRCMAKAKYDHACIGHFGLAEEEYLHFTSPIRRYPDLYVHRMLRKYAFEGCMDMSQRVKDEEKAADYAELSSVRERESADAEYAVDDMKKAEYMQDHIGEVYSGLITGVQSYGFYVELENTVEGLVRIQSLTDDYYSYDQGRMQLTGIHRHKTYRAGMQVKVKCVGASAQNGTVDFTLYGKNGRVEQLNRKTKDRRKSERRNSRSAGERRPHGRKKRK